MQSGTQYSASGDGNRKKIPSGAEIDYINASQNLLIDNAGGYQSADGSSIQTYFITPFGVTKKVSTNDYIVVGADRAESNPDYPFYKDLIYFPNGAITKKTTAEELQITVTGWVYYHCTPAGAGATLANAATLPVQDELNYYYAIAKVTLTAGVITEITQYQYGPIVLTGMYFDEGMILEGPGIDVTYTGAVATVTSLLESTDGTIDVSLGAAGAAHDIGVNTGVIDWTSVIQVKQSIEWDVDDQLHLVGDVLNPNDYEIYGYTDGLIGGTKGWHDVANFFTDTDTIDVQGGVGAKVGFEVFYEDSLEKDGVTGALQLENDAAAPGNSKYYGTNGAGTRGYYDLPSGGGYTSTVTGSILTGDGAADFAEDTNNLFTASSVDIMKDAAGDVDFFADAASGEEPSVIVHGNPTGTSAYWDMSVNDSLKATYPYATYSTDSNGHYFPQRLVLMGGTASAPSITFIGNAADGSDGNTGIFRKAENQFAITAGGQEYVFSSSYFQNTTANSTYSIKVGQGQNSDPTYGIYTSGARITGFGMGRVTGTGEIGLFHTSEPQLICGNGFVEVGSYAASGETPSLKVSGYRAGDSLRTLSLGASASVNNQFDFSGVGTLDFQATVKINSAYTLPTADASANGEVITRNSSGTATWDTLYSSPGAVSTLGAATEGSEAADATTYTVAGSNGLDFYMISRVGYYDAGNETLYAYTRKMTFNEYGVLYSVGAETRVVVDVPVSW